MLEAANWTTRLTELAREAGVPGAVLGIWADGRDDDDPWPPVSFGELADQSPYLILGGRITPRVA